MNLIRGIWWALISPINYCRAYWRIKRVIKQETYILDTKVEYTYVNGEQVYRR